MSPLADRIPILRVLAQLHAGNLAALSPTDPADVQALATLKSEGLRLPKAQERTKLAAHAKQDEHTAAEAPMACASSHPGQEDAPTRLAALARAAGLKEAESLRALPKDHLASVLHLLAHLASAHADFALLIRQHHLAWIPDALQSQDAPSDFASSLAAVTAKEIARWQAPQQKIERHSAPPSRKSARRTPPLALRESQQ